MNNLIITVSTWLTSDHSITLPGWAWLFSPLLALILVAIGAILVLKLLGPVIEGVLASIYWK